MHQISQHTIQLAQKHALQSLELGKSIEKFGKGLQNNTLFEVKTSQSIKGSGKTIQEKSQAFLEKTQQLAEDNSTEVFTKCLQVHIEVNQSCIEAVREYQKRLMIYLSQLK